MFEVQKYLKSKTLDELSLEFGIKCSVHDNLPLVILNYSMIDQGTIGHKTHPIVRECRGLILHKDDFSLVGRSFYRFFNWGEVVDEMSLFDFSDFVVHTKEDGSLVLIYHFDGEWHANTRGSFGLDKIQFCNFTWRQAFADSLKLPSISHFSCDQKDLTFVCEYCSPYNKVVRQYPTPQMFLLTVFRGYQELSWYEVDELAKKYGFLRPTRHHFQDIKEIEQFLRQQESNDPTFEGVVICDKHGQRWKIKNPIYLSLHRLKGEGDNLFNPKYLLPFILSGEESELLCYFGECRESLDKYKSILEGWKSEIRELWEANKHLESQKEFALKVQKHPFSCFLFSARKLGVDPIEVFRESPDVLLKHLKGR